IAIEVTQRPHAAAHRLEVDAMATGDLIDFDHGREPRASEDKVAPLEAGVAGEAQVAKAVAVDVADSLNADADPVPARPIQVRHRPRDDKPRHGAADIFEL